MSLLQALGREPGSLESMGSGGPAAQALRPSRPPPNTAYSLPYPLLALSLTRASCCRGCKGNEHGSHKGLTIQLPCPQ